MTNLARILERDGLRVLRDCLECPDCRKMACLVYKFTTNELWYECVGGCEIDATDDEEVPYWACDVCEGAGDLENQMCNCWLPAPVHMLDDEIELNGEPSHTEEVLAMSYHF